MRASVALVGSCQVVQIPLQPFHWMTWGFSCASVDDISAQKKSGMPMNDAIAHGPRPRDDGSLTGYPKRRDSGGTYVSAGELTRTSRPRARVRGTDVCAARVGR